MKPHLQSATGHGYDRGTLDGCRESLRKGRVLLDKRDVETILVKRMLYYTKEKTNYTHISTWETCRRG